LNGSALPPDTAAIAPHPPAASGGVAGALHGLLDDVRGALCERVELLSLELSAAVDAAVQILVLLIAAAVVAVTAWLALWAAVVGLLISAGLAWPWALLLVLLINLIVTCIGLFRARLLLPRLGLPATRRRLTLTPPAPAPAPAASASAPAS
jgi:hypothetical protein